MPKRSLLFFCLIGQLSVAYAQTTLDEGLNDSRELKRAHRLYGLATARQALIFNGSQYVDPPVNDDDNHPYFPTAEFDPGSIWYDGDRYDSILLLYDCWQDEIVLEHFDQQGSVVKMKLFKPKVTRFSMSGHTFVYQSNDSAALTSGFYELLYDGQIKVLAARRKMHFVETSTQRGVEHFFSSRNALIVIKDNRSFIVRQKRALLKAFADKRPAIQQFIKEKGLAFKERKETELVAIAQFYDQR